MAIDIRATVTCSLGTLISGSLSDDYIQGSGLIKTRGTAEINGIITPAIGTVVTFSYTKGGVTRTIPRTLRVMSSFADPFRRTTKVELGCKLTYFSDLQEPINWDALDDPENAGLAATDQEIVTIPIYAKSIAAECCNQLGLDPTPVAVLTNKFSIAEFDFGAGYVQILSDLLVSESYCGYLNASEDLVLINLSQDGGQGTLLTQSDIVDLGPIGVGQLPGEAVIVEYSTLKLQDPDGTVDAKDPTLLWEINTTTFEAEYYLTWRPDNGALFDQIYRGIETTTVTREYQRIGDRDLVVTETTDVLKLRAGICGNACQTWLKIGGVANSDPEELLPSKQVVTYTYDADGNVEQQETVNLVSTSHVIGKFGVPIEYDDGSYVYVGYEDPTIVESREVVTFTRTDEPVLVRRYGYGETSGTFYQTQEQTTTELFTLGSETIEGQQTIATAGTFMDTAIEAAAYYNGVLNRGVVLDRVVVDGGTKLFSPQERPPTADLLNAARGQTVASEAEVVLALGSAEAQRRITFRMPYAPDDTFSGPTGGPFTATPSDAEQKAITYGRVQNRLLLGNRSGMNIQLAPERLPAAPFAPMYVQANGLTAMYRANGNQWSFSKDGIACSTDALFWAAVAGTGDFWFPVAPGVTVLPSTPSAGTGVISPGDPVVPTLTPTAPTIPPYNETIPLVMVSRIGIVVDRLAYSLTVTPTVPALVVKTQMVVKRTLGLVSADISFTANPPSLPPPGIPSAELTFTGELPGVATFVPYDWSNYEGLTSSGTLTFNPFFFDGEEGDVGVIVIHTQGDASTLTPPSGWTAVPGSPVVDVADSGGNKLQVWVRRKDTTGDEIVTVDDLTGFTAAIGVSFRGLPSTGDPVEATATGTKTSASTTATLPGVTVGTKYSVLLFIVADDTFDLNSYALSPGVTGATDDGVLRSQGKGTVLVRKLFDPDTGATGDQTATLANSTKNAYLTLLLKGY